MKDKAADEKILEALERTDVELKKSPHPSICSKVISIITILPKEINITC